MASSKEYLEFILEQLSGLDEISYGAMMGEYIDGFQNVGERIVLITDDYEETITDLLNHP